MPTVVILFIILHFADGKPAIARMPMETAEICWDAASQASNIRKHNDRPVVAVEAGCFVPNETKNTSIGE